MNEVFWLETFQLFLGVTNDFLPRRVDLQQVPVKIANRKHVERKRKKPIALRLRFQLVDGFSEPAPMLGLLDLSEALGLMTNFLGLFVKLDEDGNFCTQNLRYNRTENIVNRTERITTLRLVFSGVCRGDENNRRVFA